jgi:hypothetical protein
MGPSGGGLYSTPFMYSLSKQKLIISEIKCICLNVCGIKSKLFLPEFIQLITTHDICIFIEKNN